MRGSGLVALALSLVALVLVGLATLAPAAPPPARLAAQGGTPVVVIPTAAPPAVEPAASPAAQPAAPAPTAATAAPAPAETDVVTLVAWYANGPDNAYLDVLPLQTDAALVAGPVAGAASIGRADFPDPTAGLPTVTINDSTFNAYLRFEGDTAERWTWLDDSDGARPATLVIQVEGVAGAYQGYFGTATFVSRDDGAGGVLTLALRPPGSAPSAAAADDAAAEAPAADVPAEEAPAEEVVDPAAAGTTGEVIEPDAPIEEPTDLAGDEGEAPAT